MSNYEKYLKYKEKYLNLLKGGMKFDAEDEELIPETTLPKIEVPVATKPKLTHELLFPEPSQPISDIVCIDLIDTLYTELNKDINNPTREYFVNVLKKSDLKDIFPDNKIYPQDLSFIYNCLSTKLGKSNKGLRMKIWEVIDYITEIEFNKLDTEPISLL
jgi:hypothetical protein